MNKEFRNLLRDGGQAVLIDHHKTALHLNAHPWASVTVQQEDGKLTSATSLFYEYAVEQNWLSRSRNVGGVC